MFLRVRNGKKLHGRSRSFTALSIHCAALILKKNCIRFSLKQIKLKKLQTHQIKAGNEIIDLDCVFTHSNKIETIKPSCVSIHLLKCKKFT